MKYFTIPELLRSDVAAQYRIANTPDPTATANLKTLVAAVLDPVREAYGSPVIVSSGYRCPALNAKVGGVEYSFHLRGMAADIYPKDGDLERLWRTIGKLFISRKIGITECYIDRGRGYIHIAHNPEEFNEWPFISKP